MEHNKVTDLQALGQEAYADLEDISKAMSQLQAGYSKDILEQKKQLKLDVLKAVGTELDRYKT
ncbi:hypothetical protein MUO14_18850 [Halobacillus shinanisalinarum]|uniref:Uncharacterized protein n=2 Tax=Halobacillus TaxID=45667 RepID=A0ABY4HGE8_9BACI|nr:MULTISPECIES: hypothetical protein [Halobacillus]UOQ92490.1 hypothetical protein MUO14_18850 [Halobacillus shinanisalinarum]UOR13453.1 hypothetical protein MUO15_08365 [Halobacillus amylolyticus]